MRILASIIIFLTVFLLVGCTQQNEEERLTYLSPNKGPVDENYIDTGKELNGYKIIFYPSGICDDWGSGIKETEKYIITFTNTCPIHDGMLYFQIGYDVVEIETFIPEHYEYSSDDEEILDYLGVTYEVK